MQQIKAPKRVWNYLAVWIYETGNLSVSRSRYAKGRNALEIITGETPDTSEYLNFGFYDWVTYQTNAGLSELRIIRWMGVSHKDRQIISYWILTVFVRPVSCINVHWIT